MTPEEVRNQKLKKELIEDRRKKINSKEQNTKKNPIDFRILLLIVTLALAYQLYLSYGYSEEYAFLDAYLAGSFLTGVVAITVGKKFWYHDIFRTSYIALGISFFMLFIGDMTYIYYDIALGVDPYPSVADAFYLAFPLFAVIHLSLNIKNFNQGFSTKIKILIGLLGVGLVSAYTLIAYMMIQETNFDFYFGLLYVITSAIMLCLAVCGVMVFRHSNLAMVWMLIATGIIIYTISDTWYYLIELFEGFSLNHPTNTLWILSFMTITYGLILHHKISAPAK